MSCRSWLLARQRKQGSACFAPGGAGALPSPFCANRGTCGAPAHIDSHRQGSSGLQRRQPLLARKEEKKKHSSRRFSSPSAKCGDGPRLQAGRPPPPRSPRLTCERLGVLLSASPRRAGEASARGAGRVCETERRPARHHPKPSPDGWLPFQMRQEASRFESPRAASCRGRSGAEAESLQMNLAASQTQPYRSLRASGRFGAPTADVE